MRMSNRNARASFIFACALLYAFPVFALDSASANFRNTRSAVDSGGAPLTSTSYSAGATIGGISGPTASAATFSSQDGLMAVQYYPAQIVDLAASTTSAAGGVSLTWTAPGDDSQASGTTVSAYVVKYSSVAALSPAASDANFDAAAALAPPAPLVQGSVQTASFSGLQEGVTYYFAVKSYEADGTPSPLSLGATVQTNAPFGCATALFVDKTGAPYSTISSALAALPSSLAGYSCVIVRDGATYAEQITVEGFTNNGSSITIMGDPGSGFRPVVSPPAGSTAAFQVMQASVNVYGIDVAPTNAMTYGVVVSSAYVALRDIRVLDAFGRISAAGVLTSDWTTITAASVTTRGGAAALWLTGVSWNSISDSSFTNTTGAGILIQNASDESVSRSTAIAAAPLTLYNSQRVSVSDTFLYSDQANAIQMSLGGHHSIVRSTASTDGGGAYGVFMLASANNTIASSYLSGSNGSGMWLQGNSNDNTITQSTVTSAADGNAALFIFGSSHNVVTGSWILNPAGYGIALYADAEHNLVIASTMTAGGDAQVAYWDNLGYANTVLDSYMQGSTAAFVTASTGAAFGGSVFASTGSAGAALRVGSGSVGLTLSSSTLRSPPGGFGLILDAGNGGALTFATNTITGAKYGVLIATQAAGAGLSVTSMTFAGLAPGSTAMFFTGGTFVSTFTTARFGAGVAVNVYAAALDPASRITLRKAGGRQGPAFEDDPDSLVDWPDLVPPGSPSLWYVGSSSAGVQFGVVGADGYVVDASTASDFTGVVLSSGAAGAQAALAPAGLDPNTTYYLRVGALWDETTVYAGAVVSTMTLAQLVSGTTVYRIDVTSAVVNWSPLASAPPDASSNSASGYVLEVSSRADFIPLWTASSTPNVALSTLTAAGLAGGVTYYFRVGSLNMDGAANFAAYTSTLVPIQLGVSMTTRTLSIPGLTNMNAAVVISTGIVLINTGNVPETYYLSATTATAGSPWRIGASQAQDQFVLWGVVNSTQPADADFLAADKLSDVEAPCAAGVFTMGNEACVQVPAGGTNTLWMRLATPAVTSTSAAQDIRITARAVKDP